MDENAGDCPTGTTKSKSKFVKKAIIGTAAFLFLGAASTGLYYGGRETVKFVKKVNATCATVDEIKSTVKTINTNAAAAAEGVAIANMSLAKIETAVNDVGEGVAYMIINGVKIQLTQEQVQKLNINVKVSKVVENGKKPSWLRKLGHKLGLASLTPKEKEMKVEGVDTAVVESTSKSSTTINPAPLPRIAQPQPKKLIIEQKKD